MPSNMPPITARPKPARVDAIVYIAFSKIGPAHFQSDCATTVGRGSTNTLSEKMMQPNSQSTNVLPTNSQGMADSIWRWLRAKSIPKGAGMRGCAACLPHLRQGSLRTSAAGRKRSTYTSASVGLAGSLNASCSVSIALFIRAARTPPRPSAFDSAVTI